MPLTTDRFLIKTEKAMGKTQSKRSVDITTDSKKACEDEVTEKMEKIEDIDQKVMNGDAAIQEKVNSEKKDAEELENDKDITTEKKVDSLAGGDSVDPPPAAETPKDDSSATGEEISPLSEENGKKNKKEKVKKKWSFRSISFGKKDKQKPPKNDDDMSCANNGTEEKTVPNTKEPEESQEDHLSNAAGVVNEQTAEQNENCHATNKDLSEQQGEEKLSESLTDEENKVTTVVKTEINTNVQKQTAVELEQTEKPINITSETFDNKETAEVVVTFSSQDGALNNVNGPTDSIEMNGKEAAFEVINENLNDKSISGEIANETTTTTTATAFLNGENTENIDTNGESELEQTKAQIEVNTKTDKTHAVTLEKFSSPSISPVPQTQIQDFDEKTRNQSADYDEKIIAVVATGTECSQQQIEENNENLPPPLPKSPPPSPVFQADNTTEIELRTNYYDISETAKSETCFQDEYKDTSPPISVIKVDDYRRLQEEEECSNAEKDSVQNLHNPDYIPETEQQVKECVNNHETSVITNILEIMLEEASNINQQTEIKTEQIITGEESQEDIIRTNSSSETNVSSPTINTSTEVDESNMAITAAVVVNEIAEKAMQIMNENSLCQNDLNISDEMFGQPQTELPVEKITFESSSKQEIEEVEETNEHLVNPNEQRMEKLVVVVGSKETCLTTTTTTTTDIESENETKTNLLSYPFETTIETSDQMS
ncbi:hypothetical protein GQX74_002059 [Glossina fuscipes]|nr:hypothetical protein GQX74_002059 [Glossina fuscipes]